MESLRFHFNLTLASLKTLANHSENGGTGANGTGAPNEIPKVFEKQRTASLYPSEPMQEAPGKLHHLTEQLLFDFEKQSQAPSPKGTGRAPPRRTDDNKKPSDRITHAGTIKISRSE